MNTDGAIARFYKRREWRALLERYFAVEGMEIRGQKSELFPVPASRLKDVLMDTTPDAVCRFVLNTLRQGSFLISRVYRDDVPERRGQ